MRAVLPGDLEPCRCTCTGEGLAHATAGQLASFRIHTLDGFGNTRTPGGDAFQVSAQSTEEGLQLEAVAGRVEDLGQGMYRAAYTATVAGSYEVAVTALSGETSECFTISVAVCLGTVTLLAETQMEDPACIWQIKCAVLDRPQCSGAGHSSV